MYENRPEDKIFIPLIIINILVILVGAYLFFLVIKTKSFKNFNWFYNIIFCFIIFTDNILRILPLSDDEGGCNNYEDTGAFFLVFFDKLILVTLSMNSFITYLGLIQRDFYEKNKKSIFFITCSISFTISAILTGIYLGKGIESYKLYCYAKSSTLKKILDSIFNGIFLLISFFCYVRILMFLVKKKNSANDGTFVFLSYNHYFNSILIKFIINVATFVESYLIIYDKLPDDYVDLIYVITCFLVDLNITLNEEVIKETKKIFCSKNEKKKPLINNCKTKFEDEDDEEKNNNSFELERKRTDSF